MLSLYRKAMTPKTAANIPPGNFNEMAAFGLGAAVVCSVAEAVERVLVLVELVLVVNVEEELDSEVVPLEELLDVLPVDVEAELPVMDLVADAVRDDAEPVVPEMENLGVKLKLSGLVSSMISIV